MKFDLLTPTITQIIAFMDWNGSHEMMSFLWHCSLKIIITLISYWFCQYWFKFKCTHGFEIQQYPLMKLFSTQLNDLIITSSFRFKLLFIALLKLIFFHQRSLASWPAPTYPAIYANLRSPFRREPCWASPSPSPSTSPSSCWPGWPAIGSSSTTIVSTWAS